MAGALTTAAWLPQLIRTWRLRSTEGISAGYLGVFGTGVGGWLVYGCLTGDTAIIVTNAVTLALLLSLVVVKYRR
jgi:MtN3 and saliva related transmembrane protein